MMRIHVGKFLYNCHSYWKGVCFFDEIIVGYSNNYKSIFYALHTNVTYAEDHGLFFDL